MGVWFCMDHHHDLLCGFHGLSLAKDRKQTTADRFVPVAMDIECGLESALFLLAQRFSFSYCDTAAHSIDRFPVGLFYAGDEVDVHTHCSLFHLAAHCHIAQCIRFN